MAVSAGKPQPEAGGGHAGRNLLIALVVLALLFIGVCGEDDESEQTGGEATATEQVEEAPTTTETTTTEQERREQPTTPPEARDRTPPDKGPERVPRRKAPPVQVIEGSGAAVETVRLAANSPLVVTGTHEGQSDFIVDLVGRGSTSDPGNLFNEIGNYEGQTAVAGAASGRYRVRVAADGPWTIRFAQPVPTARAKKVPGTLRGNGAEVVPVVANEDLQPVVVDATHSGEFRFTVDVIGYGETSGTAHLFSMKSATWEGETSLDGLPEGTYLVHTKADGAWTIDFSP